MTNETACILFLFSSGIDMAKSSHRSTTILQRVCILYQSRLAPMMDVKKLNVFQWCRFLRHAGRCVMMVFVLVIISGLVVASFSTTLQQGMTSDNVWLRVGSYLLSLIYMLTVRLISNRYILC